MVKAQKYVVKNKFEGLPKREDFEIVEYEVPALKDGEILVKTEWISVDPYQRAVNYDLPYDQYGFQVGTVVESKDPAYAVGSKVVSHAGWNTYTILNKHMNNSTKFLDRYYPLPDLQGLSESMAVGAVGMPGVTSYFGFLDICKPQSGETVVVTGAAGAVGSLVGQIAKIKGCKVIGFAGSDDKVSWLEKDLGFDKVLNYKKVDIAKALKEAAPNGVDCFFDNVGGEMSSVIINQMNTFGRVSVCGSISSYNDANLPKATILQPSLVFKQLKMEGFLVSRWDSQWDQAFKELVAWIKSGQLKAKEHVIVGFENMFDAFIGLFRGDNFGKAVVKV